MANYINNILKRGSFEFEGSNVKYAVNSIDKVIWFQLADICNAIGVKNWFNPESKDYVLENLSGKRKTSFVKSQYAWGIQETDVIWFLEGYAETDSIRGDRALRLQKVIKAFVKSEKQLGMSSFVPRNVKFNIDGYTNLREESQQNESSILNLPIIFNYCDNPITFKNVDGSIMVNATEMARQYGKRTTDWVRLPSTKKFLVSLTEVRKSHFAYIQSVKGGSNAGGETWMHEDVALEFARWLAPEFAIWCNDRIKELITTGSTSLTPNIGGFPIPQKFSDALLLSAHLQQKVEEQEAKIIEDKPKVAYYSDMVENRDYFTTTTIATELRTTAQILNQYLSKRGVLKGCSGVWKVTDEHQSLLVPSPFKTIIRWNHEGRTLLRQLWEEREVVEVE